jgi:hypothetical protein
VGHEDRFPLVGRSVGCPFGHETFAEASGAKYAPIPAIRRKRQLNFKLLGMTPDLTDEGAAALVMIVSGETGPPSSAPDRPSAPIPDLPAARSHQQVI